MPLAVEGHEFGFPLTDDQLNFLLTVDVGLGSPFDALCESLPPTRRGQERVSDVMRGYLAWLSALNDEYGGSVSHAASQMVFGWALARFGGRRFGRAERAVLISPFESFRELC